MLWCTAVLLFTPLGPGDGVGPNDRVKEELRQFQGAWKAVSIQDADGRKGTKEEVQNTQIVIDGNKFKLTGKDYTIEGSFKINPATTPKSIDVVLTAEDGRETKFLGIYETKGKTRKSCFALQEKERPKEFSTDKGYFGFEWTRK
jgi:uncharacterized protein (TIGR03067 family)